MSTLPPDDVQHLGVFSPGTRVSFNMPRGAAGFSIVSQAVATQTPFINCYGTDGLEEVANVPVPTPVLTPTGASFFDFTASVPLDQTTATLLSFGYYSPPYTATLTFPNTTAGLAIVFDGGLPGGKWAFDVNDYANEFVARGQCLNSAGTSPNTYDISVVVTPGPLPPTGKLAVDIYLVTQGLDAGSAVKSAGIQQFAAKFTGFLASASICVTSITFHDVPAWAIAKYSSVSVDSNDPCSDNRQISTLAENGRSMALFFVDDLVTNGAPAGGVILGVDPAVPGNATYSGTLASGALVVSADAFAASCTPQYCGPDVVANSAAHETGHFLGLLHPSEASGQFFDPLTDTPSCVCALCETDPGLAMACGNNPDGGQPAFILDSACNTGTQLCGGANLLMFWAFTTTADITPQEAAVMRANPLIAAP